MDKTTTTIIGIGNILLGDDGIGVHVVHELQRRKESSNQYEQLELIDGGTAIFDMLHIFTQFEDIIIVDSVKGGHPPGTVYKLAPEDLGEIIRETSSLHEVQILDVLAWIKHLGYEPKVIIIGVEPEEIGYSMELTPTVANTVERVINEINKILKAC